MINDHTDRKNQSMVFKIQISTHVNFISSLDTRETSTIYIRSVDKETTLGSETKYCYKTYWFCKRKL